MSGSSRGQSTFISCRGFIVELCAKRAAALAYSSRCFSRSLCFYAARRVFSQVNLQATTSTTASDSYTLPCLAGRRWVTIILIEWGITKIYNFMRDEVASYLGIINWHRNDDAFNSGY